MTDQFDPDKDKREWRAMWIMSAIVILLIVGGMGINVLIHHDTNAGANEMSGQMQTVLPPK